MGTSQSSADNSSICPLLLKPTESQTKYFPRILFSLGVLFALVSEEWMDGVLEEQFHVVKSHVNVNEARVLLTVEYHCWQLLQHL